ncbi:squalene/phytoene synthase family protein [Akkermansiaceae bacterium]|nr:squalene/phytoene synthase family protein [Akkermansiaceae bacterium]
MEFKEYSNLLKGVSRSFYLSIRVLPNAMRLPISLGYMLARASDTLADTDGIAAEVKLEALEAFRANNISLLNTLYQNHYKDKVADAKETALLQQIGELVSYVSLLDEVLRDEVNLVVETIIAGQVEDIRRFDLENRCVSSEEELIHYCYQVAGCVGEFWTRVGCITQEIFSTCSPAVLEKMGREFGIGLQLVNILRDRPSDLAQGRDYFPEKLSLSELQKSAWMDRAFQAMQTGLDYADSLKKKSSRLAVYLPAAIGEETLKKLSHASEAHWNSGVKVSRALVYREILAGLLR